MTGTIKLAGTGPHTNKYSGERQIVQNLIFIFLTYKAHTMKYMGYNNSVKVTHPDNEDFGKIGVIDEEVSLYSEGFVSVNFGTHVRRINVSSLLDLTYKE